MLFCHEFRNVVNLALLVLIFWVSIWVGTNFYAFYNSAIATPSSPEHAEEPLPLIATPASPGHSEEPLPIIATPSFPGHSEAPLPLIDLTSWNDADYDLRQMFEDSSDDENEVGVSVALSDLPEEPVDKERHVEESFIPLTSSPRGRAAKVGKRIVRIVCGICSGCVKKYDCSFCRFCRLESLSRLKLISLFVGISRSLAGHINSSKNVCNVCVLTILARLGVGASGRRDLAPRHLAPRGLTAARRRVLVPRCPAHHHRLLAVHRRILA